MRSRRTARLISFCIYDETPAEDTGITKPTAAAAGEGKALAFDRSVLFHLFMAYETGAHDYSFGAHAWNG